MHARLLNTCVRKALDTHQSLSQAGLRTHYLVDYNLLTLTILLERVHEYDAALGHQYRFEQRIRLR